MTEDNGEIRERTREEKLRALVRKDIHPEVTRVSKNLLRYYEEGEP